MWYPCSRWWAAMLGGLLLFSMSTVAQSPAPDSPAQDSPRCGITSVEKLDSSDVKTILKILGISVFKFQLHPDKKGGPYYLNIIFEEFSDSTRISIINEAEKLANDVLHQPPQLAQRLTPKIEQSPTLIKFYTQSLNDTTELMRVHFPGVIVERKFHLRSSLYRYSWISIYPPSDSIAYFLPEKPIPVLALTPPYEQVLGNSVKIYRLCYPDAGTLAPSEWGQRLGVPHYFVISVEFLRQESWARLLEKARASTH